MNVRWVIRGDLRRFSCSSSRRRYFHLIDLSALILLLSSLRGFHSIPYFLRYTRELVEQAEDILHPNEDGMT